MKESVLTLQYDLQRESYGYDLPHMTSDEIFDYVQWNITALVHEVMEAQDETSWKPWQTGKYLRREAILKELIDAAHFFNNIWLAATGLDPREAALLFEEMYGEKNRLNARRQAEGYDGVSGKCLHCRRALDTGDVKEATDEDGVKLFYCVCGFVIDREEAPADA